jgi:dihydroflavonol-4-reductase
MAHVLVTGGAGFVGRHLVNALVARGDRVRILDVDPFEPALPGLEEVRGSIGDRAAAERALEGIDTVYHLAGIAHLWRRDKSDFDRINHVGTKSMLRAAAENGVRRFVHCSTESILLPPRRDGGVVDESVERSVADMPGPYTRSKYLGERAALAAAGNGLDVVVVNPTIPIGAGDRNMTPPAEMLSLFLSGRTPFFMDCVLNLVDVRDVADGIARAGERGRRGERYILGGENVSIRELLPRLQKKSGRRMPRHAIPASIALTTGVVSDWLSDRITGKPPVATREGVVLALRSAPFDSGKARRELGYAPASIDRALTEAVEAFKRTV